MPSIPPSATPSIHHEAPRPASIGAPRACALLVGPALLLVGVVLMMLPSLWTLSHVVFLAGTIAMAPTGVVLHDLTRDRRPVWLGRAALVLTLAGALALAGQFVIDLVVIGLAGGDADAVHRMFDSVQSVTALDLALYTAGPALLFVGLAGFAVGLMLRSRHLRLPGCLVVVGAVLIGLARTVGSRPSEVVALALILVGLAVIARGRPSARLGRGGRMPDARPAAATDPVGQGDAPRRRRRVVVVGVLGATVIAVSGISLATGLPALATSHDQIRLPIEQQRLRMVVSSGDVVLRHGTGSQLLVERTTRRGLAEPRVVETSDSGGIVIEADCSGQLNARCGVSYDITIPDGFDLDIEIEAGSLTARDITVDELHARIANGDVALAGVTGAKSVVDVASGEVALDFAAAPASVVATVSSGRIQIGLPKGSYDVTTEVGAGDERVEVPIDPASDRTISARTGRGDIEVVSNGR